MTLRATGDDDDGLLRDTPVRLRTPCNLAGLLELLDELAPDGVRWSTAVADSGLLERVQIAPVKDDLHDVLNGLRHHGLSWSTHNGGIFIDLE